MRIHLPLSGQAGVGLRSIRERCAELGGSAGIRSGNGSDTVVTARTPARARTQASAS